MNKKLTVILLTNLVMAGSMVTDVSASAEQPLLEPQTSSSIGLSLTERMEQLKQQVNTFRGHLSSVIENASEVMKDLGTLREQLRLREQIEEAGAEAAPRADLMPHTVDASTQADDPDTFVWDGTGVVPKDVTKVRIADGVTNIRAFTFKNCTKLTSITMPNSVKSIGFEAFDGCTNLISIAIPKSVKSIGDYAFWECTGLTSITIPNSVTSIGKNAFCYTGLTSITIPNSVTSIGENAFCYTGLTSITIPSRFKGQERRIGIPASCTVIYDADTVEWNGTGGVPKDVIKVRIAEGVTSIKAHTFEGCTELRSIIIPNSVTSIGFSTFSGCTNLTSITIPEEVTSIELSTFKNCTKLTSITMPNSVKSIGFEAFDGCTNLRSIAIPKSVKSIGDYAFWECIGLTSITIPNSVTSIGENAFCYTGLTSITIPSRFKGQERRIGIPASCTVNYN